MRKVKAMLACFGNINIVIETVQLFSKNNQNAITNIDNFNLGSLLIQYA